MASEGMKRWHDNAKTRLRRARVKRRDPLQYKSCTTPSPLSSLAGINSYGGAHPGHWSRRHRLQHSITVVDCEPLPKLLKNMLQHKNLDACYAIRYKGNGVALQPVVVKICCILAEGNMFHEPCLHINHSNWFRQPCTIQKLHSQPA